MGISPGASDIAVFEEQHIHHKLIRIFSDTAIFATCLATPYAVLESILFCVTKKSLILLHALVKRINRPNLRSNPPEDTTLLYFLPF